MMRRTAGWVGVAAVMAVAVAIPAHAEENWRRVTPEWSWPRGEFLDVAATGPDDVWAVGTQGEVCYWTTQQPVPQYPPRRYKTCPVQPKPMIQHWDGTKWTKYTPGAWAWNTGSVESILPVRPGEVYFAGSAAGNAVFMRWNGTSFENGPFSPADCGGGGGVGLSNGVLTVIGHQSMCRLVDGTWQKIPAPDGFSFSSTRTYVGAAGVYTTRFHQNDFPLTLARWSGSSWEDVVTLSAEWTYENYSYFTVFADDDIWFSRESVRPDGGTATHWRHWDGTSFTDYPVPTPSGYLGTPVRFDRDAAGVLTVSTGAEQYTRTWKFDPAASTWTELPAPSIAIPAGYKVHALTTVPGSTTQWAVGGGVEDVPNAKTDPLILTTAP